MLYYDGSIGYSLGGDNLKTENIDIWHGNLSSKNN